MYVFVFAIMFENVSGLFNAFIRLAIKLSLAMLNAWDCHCSGGEYEDQQGKPSRHKSFS